jgi:hypothetical protein
LQKLLLLLQLIKIILKAFSNLIILHQYSHYFKIDDCLLKDFDKREELLQLTYFLELLIQQFNEIIFINFTKKTMKFTQIGIAFLIGMIAMFLLLQKCETGKKVYIEKEP